MSIRCIASGQKGGVGKSTLTVLASRVSAALGIRVGVVDLAMGNPSTSMILLGNVARHTVATYVIGASRIGEVVNVVPTEHGPIYLAPSGRGDLSLLGSYSDFREGVGKIVDFMLDRLGADYVLIDFPAFEPSIDRLFGDALTLCDIVYPVGVQDPGSIIAIKNLMEFARKNRVDIGKPVINMFREALGRRWVSVVGKLYGDEPDIIHYDPWLIRFVLGVDGHHYVGVRDAVTYVINEIVK